MKKLILITALFYCSTLIFGQNEEFNLINLDSTWGQEVIRFPARNINYVGVGDIRFPPKGWIDPEHKFFWSYTYAWKIDLNRTITADELEDALVKYFNSLNKIEFGDKINKRNATATISKTKTKKATIFFNGKIDTYDRFATNKRFTLNVKIKSHFCKKKQKTFILFTFTPKNYTHEVWKTLDNIDLIGGFCD